MNTVKRTAADDKAAARLRAHAWSVFPPGAASDPVLVGAAAEAIRETVYAGCEHSAVYDEPACPLCLAVLAVQAVFAAADVLRLLDANPSTVPGDQRGDHGRPTVA